MSHADKRLSYLVLTHNTYVSVTVYDNYLLLKIRGAKTVFPRIIEQVCWLVSVASNTSISLLERYAKETNGGKTTRGYAETLYTGKPVITAGPDGRFKVSFSPPRTETHENHGSVAKTGQCWKTMAGLSIVASGYAIPQRPKHGSGLEAPLSVLRHLFKRGCPGKPVLPLDKPMVMIPTPVGKDSEVYQLRLIMAVGAQQCTQGKVIYWHFDAATLCNSMESCTRLEKQVGVNSSVIGPRSRHFVGWSSEVGSLAGKQPNNSWDGRQSGGPSSSKPHAAAAYMQVPVPCCIQSWRLAPSTHLTSPQTHSLTRCLSTYPHLTYPFLNPSHRSLLP